jgi:hypothetical protein
VEATIHLLGIPNPAPIFVFLLSLLIYRRIQSNMSTSNYVSDLEPIGNLNHYSRHPLPELATAAPHGAPPASSPISLPLAQKKAISVNASEQQRPDKKTTIKLHKANIYVCLGIFVLLLILIAGLLGGLLPKVKNNAST